MLRLILISIFLIMALVSGAFASDMFDTVPMGHWAYEAAKQLNLPKTYVGPCSGDPFLRLQPRYEFAVLTARVYISIIDNDEARGKVTRTQLLALRKLTIEFNKELSALDVDIYRMKNYLNPLANANWPELNIEHYPELAEIPKNHWACRSMKRLYELGVFEGYPTR